LDSLIACVTGASGIIGNKICKRLISAGYRVRVLSRQKHFNISGAESFIGDILKEADLEVFMQNADMVFHCAAELKDKSKMWTVNVDGTQLILKNVEKLGIRYFCYLSSIGVVGATCSKLVDETNPCNPQNIYEKSKWAAEQLVARGIKGCKVVILRPTDVVDERWPGIVALPKRSSFIDFCKVFVKGGECAHIIHSEDVARAAVHFISYHFVESPQCYIVSCDNEPLNTVSGVWVLYKACFMKKPNYNLRPVPHLPLFVPYFLRRIARGKGNMGDVRYSAEKLLKTGFTFKLGVEGAIRRIASAQGGPVEQ
jgi:nucleoside-diphosphate-sugar epimerase